MRKKLIGLIGLSLLIAVAYYICIYRGLNLFSVYKQADKKTIAESKAVEEGKKDKEITITAVGDIIVHETQLEAQYNKDTKQYDFTNNFSYVKPYIKKADMAIANLETTLSGPEKGYAGYPTFNTPDSIIDALKDTGFNVLTAANNHVLDGGSKGFFRTNKVLKEKGIDYIGIKADTNSDSYLIKDVKGVKVGITNYTFETAKAGNSKTINSIKIPKEMEGLIDSFNYQDLKNDFANMRQRIKDMKDKGAEVVIFYMHWGDEYDRQPNKYEKEIAQELSNDGVDIIFASHPHVLQPIEYVSSQVDNKETLVVYSMGNFISNQRYEILKQRYSEDGLIVNVKVKKDKDSGKISLGEVSYVPTWVNRYEKNKSFVYEIVPLIDALADNEKFDLNSEEAVWRAQNSENNTFSLIDSTKSKVAHADRLSEKDIQVMSKK